MKYIEKIIIVIIMMIGIISITGFTDKTFASFELDGVTYYYYGDYNYNYGLWVSGDPNRYWCLNAALPVSSGLSEVKDLIIHKSAKATATQYAELLNMTPTASWSDLITKATNAAIAEARSAMAEIIKNYTFTAFEINQRDTGNAGTLTYGQADR